MIPVDRPIRVMLVDDSEAFLRAAVEFLEQHEGLSVVATARSGREALDQALRLRPDVILLELEMANLTGFELLPQLRAMLPKAGIIILTLYDFRGYRQVALANGADEFIPKDELVTDLVPAIKRIAQIKREV
ncbi:MAG: response regulator transcription factor [Chloroflexi bacterium]|nr:response regulator transcription factor [Chloroflexota bacterium]